MLKYPKSSVWNTLLSTHHKTYVGLFAALFPLVGVAATRTVTTVIDTADTYMDANGTVAWPGESSSRVGIATVSGIPTGNVLPVVLPTLAAGEIITSATLSFNVEGWSNWSSYLTNLDLYGIYLTNSSSAVNSLNYYVDGTNPLSNTYASLLDDDIATLADIGLNSAGSGQTKVKTSGDLSSFFQDLYAGGAQAGEFAFLTLAHDSDLNGVQRYYNISTADSSNYAKPQVEFTITTENYLYVDGAATGAGDGSAGAPYNNIQTAINAAVGGETIVVADGVYHYGITIDGEFDASAPLTIEAASGAHPILDGAETLTGWVGPLTNDVYYMDTAIPVTTFYVGDERQPTARWPDLGQPWVNVTNIDYANDELTIDTALPPVSGDLEELTGYVFLDTQKIYMTELVTSLSSGPNRVGFDSTEFYNNVEKYNTAPSQLMFLNHKDLISVSGEWARETLSSGMYRIYFKPASVSELSQTRTSSSSIGINISGSSKIPSNITVRGLTVRNFVNSGINIYEAEYITVEDCVVYNVNSVGSWGGSYGIGIVVRSCQPTTPTTDNIVTIRNTVSAYNYMGMYVHTCENILINQCEVAKNANDGVFIRGAATSNGVSYTDSTLEWTDGVTISDCYIHHHLYELHPDNMQFVLGSRNVAVESVLSMYGYQGLISSDVESNSIRNSTFIGAGGDNVKVGGGGMNELGWDLTGSTMLFARYRTLEMSAPNSIYEGNIFYGASVFDRISTNPSDFTADYNIYWPGAGYDPLFFSWVNPVWEGFTTDIAAYRLATTQGAHSLRVDPVLTNVPLFQGVVEGNGASTDTVLRIAGANFNSGDLKHQVGDYLEINGDSILREVTHVVRSGNEELVTIDPALPEAPFRLAVSLNWGANANANTTIDTSPLAGSPALGAGIGGIDIGSQIDVGDFQAGDFDGDGIRDLPILPAELEWQLSHPNNYTHPYTVLY